MLFCVVGPLAIGRGGGGGGGGGMLHGGDTGLGRSGIGGGGGKGSGVSEERGGVCWDVGGEDAPGVSTGGGGGGGKLSLPVLILLPLVGVLFADDTVGVLKQMYNLIVNL